MPTQHDLDEWQFLVLALGSVGRRRLFRGAQASQLIPGVRRWWLEVMMEEYIGPTLRSAVPLFTPSLNVSLLPVVVPAPIVIGGD
jgi:hypothetical protein